MTTSKGIRGKRDKRRPTRCTSADRTFETKAEGVLGVNVETSQDVLESCFVSRPREMYSITYEVKFLPE